LLPALLLLALGARMVAAEEPSTARAFNIDPASSSLTIQVFRNGVLALLAHDHILTADGIAGRVLYDAASVQRSSLQLSVPVASLIVDDPEHRKRAGLDGTISQSDISSIRDIIMSADYLDEPIFPRVVATAVKVNGELPVLSVGLSVRIKQSEKVYTVPVRVTPDGDTLRASGELYLAHSDFGMKPYTSLLGLIAVQDLVLVKFDIVAREQR
jgi:polyisoprenoid-binding protein YceI